MYSHSPNSSTETQTHTHKRVAVKMEDKVVVGAEQPFTPHADETSHTATEILEQAQQSMKKQNTSLSFSRSHCSDIRYVGLLPQKKAQLFLREIRHVTA